MLTVKNQLLVLLNHNIPTPKSTLKRSSFLRNHYWRQYLDADVHLSKKFNTGTKILFYPTNRHPCTAVSSCATSEKHTTNDELLTTIFLLVTIQPNPLPEYPASSFLIENALVSETRIIIATSNTVGIVACRVILF